MSYKNVVVAGGGVLGSQIAFQSAFKGFNVTIWLRSEASIERAKPKIERLYAIYIATLDALKGEGKAKAVYLRGLVDDAAGLNDAKVEELKKKVESANKNIKYTTSMEEAGRDADLVIESVAEAPQAKVEFYTNLAKYIPEKTVIVTNSSTMLPSAFAKYTGRPKKYLALHFANEIWKNNTAEVMGQPETEHKYYEEIVEFAAQIGMVPLKLKKEQPGYILNSMLVPFLNSAEALFVNDVADPETIDKTWMLGTGAPVGPFRILDVVGLTTAYNITSMSPDAADPNSLAGKICAMLKKYIDEGKTGINAGEGFYKYK